MKKARALRIVSAAMAAVLIFGLTACNPGGESAKPSGSSAAAPSAVTTGITLNIWAWQRAGIGSLTDNRFTKEYEKKTGIHVNWTPFVDDLATQFNLSISSGNYPDMWLLELSTSQVQQCLDAGIVLPMDSYLKPYAPNFSKLLALDPAMKESITAPDGHIYSFVRYLNYNNDYETSQKLWVYEPWLKASGLPMPTTVAELENLLKYFKTHDMNGNGKNDEIPMEGSSMILNDASDPMVAVINAYQVITGGWLQADGQKNISCMAITDDYRAGLIEANKLFKEGLASPVTYTQNINDWRAFNTVSSPSQQRVGVTGGPDFARFVNAGETDRYKNWTAIPPIKKDSGSKPQTNLNLQKYSMKSLISKTTKYPEACVKWEDMGLDPELQITSAFGFEGEHWKRISQSDKTGIVFQLTDKNLYPNGASTQNVTWSVDWVEFPTYQGDLYRPFTQQFPEGTNDYIRNQKQMAANTAYKAVAKSNGIPSGNLWSTDNELITQLASLGNDINQYITQSYAQFIMGKLNINDDSVWQAYKDQLNKIGLDRYIELSEEHYFGKKS